MVCEEGAAEEERRMKRRRRVVQNQKQEPRTKMWGIQECLAWIACPVSEFATIPLSSDGSKVKVGIQ